MAHKKCVEERLRPLEPGFVLHGVKSDALLLLLLLLSGPEEGEEEEVVEEEEGKEEEGEEVVVEEEGEDEEEVPVRWSKVQLCSTSSRWGRSLPVIAGGCPQTGSDF